MADMSAFEQGILRLFQASQDTKIEALEAEIEKLRAAMADVIEAAPYGKAADIAMEALNGGKDG